MLKLCELSYSFFFRHRERAPIYTFFDTENLDDRVEVSLRLVTTDGFYFEPVDACGRKTIPFPEFQKRYLHYIVGLITAKEVAEVLTPTGKFSGCICSILAELGHLGTVERKAEQNWEKPTPCLSFVLRSSSRVNSRVEL